ncbi:MAG TPA: tyrosine--tRNA ligase [Candidatus Dormibacteraeota bacterium]|nr:tyrosine--tRNA ligase [Candidatus Dormibacteraeota bacterium]
MTHGAKPKFEMTEHKFKPVEEQLAYIKKGVAEIIPEPEFVAKLENSRKTGKALRVYLGVDPTAPDLHLGHTVVLHKLKHFQDLGHTAVFLIGDFSAMIGDPTGVSETRPPLSREQVDANAETYLTQVFKILDREKTEVRRNSDWLGKLSSYDIIRLTAKYSLPRMLEREDFRQRLSGGWKGQLFRPSEDTERSGDREEAASKLQSSGKASPVKRPPSMAIHELLYPLLTALDAVELKSDVELGATEQKFNLLVHREIQREYDLAGQAILTMPILVGLDGQRKMSKSLGNYVGITEPPSEMFGKLMSIPDDLMWSYYELLTDRSTQGVENLKKAVQTNAVHPMKAKMDLAKEIISEFHSRSDAQKAAIEFERVVQKKEMPSEVMQYFVPESGKSKLARRLVDWANLSSRAEAERLIEQGAVEINGQVIKDPAYDLDLNVPRELAIRVGKPREGRIHFFKVTIGPLPPRS